MGHNPFGFWSEKHSDLYRRKEYIVTKKLKEIFFEE